ncbi:hypothetical protein ACFJIV_11380 [Mucilaginibacter sp. UC70_90]
MLIPLTKCSIYRINSPNVPNAKAGVVTAAAIKPAKINWTKSFIPAEAKANIRNEVTAIDRAVQSTRRERGVPEELKDKRKRARTVLNYAADADGSHIVLTGKDDKKNDAYIVLDRVNRQYALTDSKLVAGKY